MPEPVKNWENIVDSLADKIEITKGPKEYFASIAHLPRPHVLLYAIFYAGAEVNNGGFSQLFYNSTGMVAPEAREGFAAIGMPKIAELFSEAMQIFGTAYPRDPDVRRQAVEAAAQRFLDRPGMSSSGRRRPASTLDVITSDAMFLDLSDKYYALEYTENQGIDKAATSYANRPENLH